MELRFFYLLLLLWAGAACLDSSAKNKCHSDGDCLNGSVCLQGTCLTARPGNDAAPKDATKLDASTRDTSTMDVSLPDTTAPDIPTQDIPTQDARPPGPDATVLCNGTACGPLQACNIDRCMTRAQYTNGFLCTQQEVCPTPQICVNGICASPCADDNDCAATQVCDEFHTYRCVPEQVESCPPTLCESNQTCLRGLCVTIQQETTCTPSLDQADGCDAWHLCIDNVDNDTARCVSMPVCPFLCPTGTVCNNDNVPGKEQICMLGLCENSTNCADNYACAVIFMEPIGYCSEGNLDAVCGNDLDCQDDLFCHLPIQNSLGQCQPVGSITCDSAGGVCWDQTSGSCPADSMYNSNYRCQDTAMDCCL